MSAAVLRGGAVASGLAVLLLAVAVAQADIYARVGPDGVLHFTDAPTAQGYVVIIREPRPPAPTLDAAWLAPDAAPPVDAAPAVGDPAFTAPDTYDPLIIAAARRYQIEVALIKAVIHAESNFNPWAVSPKGAQGLMQLMPHTAARLLVRNPWDPHENIDGGVRYLQYLGYLFRGDLRLVLAAYNAGEEAVFRYAGIPPFRETIQYVQRVLRYLADYRGQHVVTARP